MCVNDLIPICHFRFWIQKLSTHQCEACFLFVRRSLLKELCEENWLFVVDLSPTSEPGDDQGPLHLRGPRRSSLSELHCDSLKIFFLAEGRESIGPELMICLFWEAFLDSGALATPQRRQSDRSVGLIKVHRSQCHWRTDAIEPILSNSWRLHV